jgi:hypothetical protein
LPIFKPSANNASTKGQHPSPHSKSAPIHHRSKETCFGVLPYDAMLEYRNTICDHIKRQFDCIQQSQTNHQLHAFHNDDYPCVLIEIRIIGTKQFVSKEAWYSLFMAYFVSMLNKMAETNHPCIPIEIVIRSSFGHFGPSVDSAKTFFRINVGSYPSMLV